MCEVQGGQEVRRGGKRRSRQIQSMERSENPFIPHDPVAAPGRSKIIFNNEVSGEDMRRGRERKKERERSYPLKNQL